MCKLLQLVAAGILAASGAVAGITFDVTSGGTTGSGQTIYRYSYSLDGLMLQRNMEVEFRFDPAVYDELFNPTAPAQFDPLILQPDNPPGSFGIYSLFALTDNPPLTGPFTVDFTLAASAMPGRQPYFINLFDDSGAFLQRIDSGQTSPAGEVPEPATWSLMSVALLAVSAKYAGRRPN